MFHLGFFVSNVDFHSGIFPVFPFYRTALFMEKLLLHTSLTTQTQKLHFQSIYFFRAAAFFKELRFRKSHFLAEVIFSEYLIFRNGTSTQQPLCENRKFSRGVTFRISYVLGGVIVWNKDIYRGALLIEAGTSAQHQFFRRATFLKKLAFFQERNITHYLLFLESCLFRTATFSKDVTYSSNHFRRATFSQHTSPEELLFYSYDSSPQLHLLFISQ